MNTDLLHNVVDQLTIRYGKIRVVVTRKDITKKESHPDLSQSRHAGAHDSQPLPYHAPYKITSREA